MKIDETRINFLKSELENHSLLVTDVIQTKEDLQLFMSNHIFAVWDFMSLAKNVQNSITPSGGIWLPTDRNRTEAARLINEIILAEETDITPDQKSYISHFDLYIMAMLELGANIDPITQLIESVYVKGYPDYSSLYGMHEVIPAINFVKNTFNTIKAGDHCAAASFCYGREDVIPGMFIRILNQLNISDIETPKLNYYLERHIELDGDDHGDASKRIVQILCDNNPIKIYEAELAACKAIEARIQFFDQVESIINNS